MTDIPIDTPQRKHMTFRQFCDRHEVTADEQRELSWFMAFLRCRKIFAYWIGTA